MNFLTALQEAAKDFNVWFRPVSWRGSGEGLAVEQNGDIVRLPSVHGGTRIALSATVLLQEWETVVPDVVLEE